MQHLSQRMSWPRLLQLLLLGAVSHHACAQVKANDTFGPENCISLSRSKSGTCMVTTSCGSNNISNVEFAFVCFNPGTKVPHALHSFGRGGFAAAEVFDTGVNCAQCTSVDTAFSAGSPLIRNALRALPKGWLSNATSEAGGPLIAPVSTTSSPARKRVSTPLGTSDDATIPGAGQVREMKTAQAAFYGPSACVATFLSPAGTCLVQTRCAKAELAGFNVGITCLDKIGDYARYMFGVGVFDAEETFDTRLECEQCLGVSEDPAYRQINGVLPKQIMDDVSSLKDEVQMLRAEIGAILQGLPDDVFGMVNGTGNQSSATAASGSLGSEGEGAKTSSDNETGRASQPGMSGADGEDGTSGGSSTDSNASKAVSTESREESGSRGENATSSGAEGIEESGSRGKGASGGESSNASMESRSESASADGRGSGSAQEAEVASAGSTSESSAETSLEACSTFTSTKDCPTSRCTWIEANGCTEWELAPAPALAAAPASKAERVPHPRPKPAPGGAKPPNSELAAAARGPRPNARANPADHPQSKAAVAPARTASRTSSTGDMLSAKGASSSTVLADANSAINSRAAAMDDGEDTPVVLHHRHSDSHASTPTLKDLLMRFSS